MMNSTWRWCGVALALVAMATPALSNPVKLLPGLQQSPPPLSAAAIQQDGIGVCQIGQGSVYEAECKPGPGKTKYAGKTVFYPFLNETVDLEGFCCFNDTLTWNTFANVTLDPGTSNNYTVSKTKVWDGNLLYFTCHTFLPTACGPASKSTITTNEFFGHLGGSCGIGMPKNATAGNGCTADGTEFFANITINSNNTGPDRIVFTCATLLNRTKCNGPGCPTKKNGAAVCPIVVTAR